MVINLYAFEIQALGRIQTYKQHRVKTLTVIIEKFDCSQNGSFRLVALFTNTHGDHDHLIQCDPSAFKASRNNRFGVIKFFL